MRQQKERDGEAARLASVELTRKEEEQARKEAAEEAEAARLAAVAKTAEEARKVGSGLFAYKA